jgi:hypothetical protein
MLASKGIVAIILTQFCNLLTLGFTIIFSVFLMAFVDWHVLIHCKDEFSCSNSKNRLIHRPNPFDEKPPTLYGFLVVMYLILFTALWIHQCYSSWNQIVEGFRMDKFYREILVLDSLPLSIVL